MNPTLRRLAILHRAALGRWKVHARLIHALRGSERTDWPRYEAALDRMNLINDAIYRIVRAMAAL